MELFPISFATLLKEFAKLLNEFAKLLNGVVFLLVTECILQVNSGHIFFDVWCIGRTICFVVVFLGSWCNLRVFVLNYRHPNPRRVRKGGSERRLRDHFAEIR